MERAMSPDAAKTALLDALLSLQTRAEADAFLSDLCTPAELRAFAGNFLYSTGANEVAKRFTQGHFDLPMRNCTVQLDGVTVVDAGKVVA